MVYQDPQEGQDVYLTDIFGNSQSWIEARIAKLTERWVDPGTAQVRHPTASEYTCANTRIMPLSEYRKTEVALGGHPGAYQTV